MLPSGRPVVSASHLYLQGFHCRFAGVPHHCMPTAPPDADLSSCGSQSSSLSSDSSSSEVEMECILRKCVKQNV